MTANGFDYKQYWESTYAQGGTSGSGSYGVLADFKAEVINGFIREHGIRRVIEFGCGDGNQLSLMNYEQYLGLDVAGSSIDLCAHKFSGDPGKSFLLYEPKRFINNGFLAAELVVCLDVLYHITDDLDFRKTLDDIFSCNADYVILYTRLTGDGPSVVPTIQDRDILRHLQTYEQRYAISGMVQQKHAELSSAVFIMLTKR